ncbi:MAG: chemotaxis protein CheD [Candidatus Anammoxibacter sp.]
MENAIERKNVLVKPGDLCFPEKTNLLCAVVGSGVAITVFDTKRRCGGMCYYIKPLRNNPNETSTSFACPSIIGLLNMLLGSGSQLKYLEAQLYGGAANQKAEGHINGLGDQNVNVAKEILNLQNVRIVGTGIGGTYGRKVVFDTSSGETVIAKVDNIRSSDWYPTLITSAKQN